MSLLGSMTQGKKRNITINVEDVRPNPMNMYHFEDEIWYRKQKHLEYR